MGKCLKSRLSSPCLPFTCACHTARTLRCCAATLEATPLIIRSVIMRMPVEHFLWRLCVSLWLLASVCERWLGLLQRLATIATQDGGICSGIPSCALLPKALVGAWQEMFAASRTSTTLDLILMVIPELSTLEHPKSAGCRTSASAVRLGTLINELPAY